ncbi:hypothetical protein ACFXG4_04790 [Nocardia sp. NPDC059246]|uniref:hypothetical protein n=1 Tax=unclassified Nocardia TaxID=2637762 RepID=UPI0036794900
MTPNLPTAPNAQGLTNDELVTVLQVITAYDNRSVDSATIAAWGEAARRKRWTFAEAIDAVHEYFSDNTARLMPGHITQIIRRDRGKNWQE